MKTVRQSGFCPRKRALPAQGVAVAVLLVAVPIIGQSQVRQEEAHEHGVSALNIAIEGSAVSVELSGPMANFVGFEHVPENEDEEAALDQAVERLNSPLTLLVPSPEANCSIAEVSVLAPDAHAAGEHEHDDHDDHADDDHEGDQEHADHDDDHESHLEIEASYELACQNPNRLAFIDVRLFAEFPATESVEVQVLGVDAIVVRELSPGNERLALQD